MIGMIDYERAEDRLSQAIDGYDGQPMTIVADGITYDVGELFKSVITYRECLDGLAHDFYVERMRNSVLDEMKETIRNADMSTDDGRADFLRQMNQYLEHLP